MRKDAPALKVFQRIKNQAKTNLNELCDFWNIYEKQLFFVSAIAIYDRYFIEQLSQNSKKSFYDRILSTAILYSSDSSMIQTFANYLE